MCVCAWEISREWLVRWMVVCVDLCESLLPSENNTSPCQLWAPQKTHSSSSLFLSEIPLCAANELSLPLVNKLKTILTESFWKRLEIRVKRRPVLKVLEYEKRPRRVLARHHLLGTDSGHPTVTSPPTSPRWHNLITTVVIKLLQLFTCLDVFIYVYKCILTLIAEKAAVYQM